MRQAKRDVTAAIKNTPDQERLSFSRLPRWSVIVLTTLISLEGLSPSSFVLAQTTPSPKAQSPGIAFQGKLYNENGIDPILDQVDLTISVYDPSGSCLLFEEKRVNVDLEFTGGAFSVMIGDSPSLRVSGRDSNLSVWEVFSNEANYSSVPSGVAPSIPVHLAG